MQQGIIYQIVCVCVCACALFSSHFLSCCSHWSSVYRNFGEELKQQQLKEEEKKMFGTNKILWSVNSLEMILLGNSFDIDKMLLNCVSIYYYILYLFLSMYLCFLSVFFIISFQLYHTWHFYRSRQHLRKDVLHKKKLLPVKSGQNICSSNSIKTPFHLAVAAQLLHHREVQIPTPHSIIYLFVNGINTRASERIHKYTQSFFMIGFITMRTKWITCKWNILPCGGWGRSGEMFLRIVK